MLIVSVMRYFFGLSVPYGGAEDRRPSERSWRRDAARVWRTLDAKSQAMVLETEQPK
jgi:hypothetical protein